MRIHTREQSNKRSGMRLKTERLGRDVGRVRLARLARVRLLRHALPISLLIWRKNPTVLQSTSASKYPLFYIHEGQIRYSFWAKPPRIGHCREYSPPPPYVSRIFPPLNLNNSLNIPKESVLNRTLIVPIKVNQLPSYRTSKISLNEY